MNVTTYLFKEIRSSQLFGPLIHYSSFKMQYSGPIMQD